MADQTWFGEVSGDVNPMHVDALRARRTQAGAPVVHGMHAAIWALDRCAALRTWTGALTLEIRFRRFLYVGDDAALRVEETADGLRIAVTSRGLDRASLRLRTRAAPTDAAASTGDGESSSPTVTPVDPIPRDLTMADLANLRGAFPAPAVAPIAARYPGAAAAFGGQRLAALAGLSTLVGMVAPGLHSIFDGLRVEFAPIDERSPATIRYEVVAIEERFRKLAIAVTGPGLRGSVDAYVRHAPTAQLSLAEARGLVAPDEFRGVSALVVGGSRGLGAATATLLAAGGASVAITYRVGEDDARSLAAALGPHASAHRFDAREPADPQLAAIGTAFDLVAYFATATIADERVETFSSERFRELAEIYVDGFARLVTALATTARPTRVLYPSTVYVTERPRKMTEYAMAKAAGEVLAEDLGRAHPSITCVVERLPRVLTDQTASVMPSEADDAAAVMLRVLRRKELAT